MAVEAQEQRKRRASYLTPLPSLHFAQFPVSLEFYYCVLTRYMKDWSVLPNSFYRMQSMVDGLLIYVLLIIVLSLAPIGVFAADKSSPGIQIQSQSLELSPCLAHPLCSGLQVLTPSLSKSASFSLLLWPPCK